MRSVVVVLPASMWATMPMFLVFSRPTRLGVITVAANVPPRPSLSQSCLRSPAVVREGLVRLGHAVRVLALLHGAALPGGGIQDLRRQFGRHAPAVFALPGVVHEPAQTERHPPLQPYLDRHLIGGTADPPRPHLQQRHDVAERLVQHLRRILAGLALDLIETPVDDVL